MVDHTHDRDLALMAQLQQIEPGVGVELLLLAEPETVARVVAGTLVMLGHDHAMNIEPGAYLDLMAENDREKALYKAAAVVAALERKGYVIAARLPGETEA